MPAECRRPGTDADEALDSRALATELCSQLGKHRELARHRLLAAVTAKDLELVVVEAPPTEQLSDQSSAGVRDQMDLRVDRQQPGQLERVGGGARRERVVLEREDAIPVALAQRFPLARGLERIDDPFAEQPAEAAHRARGGAVQEDQRRNLRRVERGVDPGSERSVGS